MKRQTILAIVGIASLVAFAKPNQPGRSMPRPAPRPAPTISRRPIPMPPPRHLPSPHHSPSLWGRGGRNFWPGFVGGLVGSTLVSPPPIVVAPPPPPRPVVFIQQEWVPPVYEYRPVYDMYGNVIRYDQVIIRAGYYR